VTVAAGKTVLILGGGTGGLVAANRLRRMLSKEHRVVLVDRTPAYSFAPSFTWVMLGQRDGRRITRDLRTLEKKGVQFRIGEILRIDPAAKRVLIAPGAVPGASRPPAEDAGQTVDVQAVSPEGRVTEMKVPAEELAYDYLVVALGAQYSAEEIEGLGRAWTYYHLEGAEGLQEELPRFRGGRIAIVVSMLPYKCPPAPYEGALLLEDYFRRRRRDVQITVITPERSPLRVAGEQVSERIASWLEQRGVALKTGRQLQRVDHKEKKLHFHDGSSEPFDLLIATPVHVVPDVLVASGFAQPRGWVAVDRETLASRFEDVYVIGDCTQVPIGEGLALPKAGVFAHGEAEVVARNLAAEIGGGQPVWAFGGQGACFLETGGGRGAYITGDFFAEPAPRTEIRGPGRFWHYAKLGFERLWLWRWF
jgi:sulfide:quinone oxidoreductase